MCVIHVSSCKKYQKYLKLFFFVANYPEHSFCIRNLFILLNQTQVVESTSTLKTYKHMITIKYKNMCQPNLTLQEIVLHKINKIPVLKKKRDISYQYYN